jgi:glucarate dehydratase
VPELPRIRRTTVIPVAGRDSFLLNLSGGHAPFVVRNLVLLEDSAGRTGVGETIGGEAVRQTLEASAELVVNRSLDDIDPVLNSIRTHFASLDACGRGVQTFDQRVMIHAVTAIEAAMLDLTGQALGVPVANLLGDGPQRDGVEALGYLFFLGDRESTTLPYPDYADSGDPWDRARSRETLDARGIVEQALAAKGRFGFSTFKLKAGVLDGITECECIAALAEALPGVKLTIDPNGCWTVNEAIDWLTPLKSVLLYAEDPCGAEGDLTGLESLVEFRRRTGISTATNMVAVDFSQLAEAIRMEAVDVPLADCHFWTMRGAVEVSKLCREHGLTWGSHSNNHFDVSLAMMTHVAAAAGGKVTAIDTHWIWQVGQRLTRKPLEIRAGRIAVPQSPGLGIQVDTEQVAQANRLYKSCGLSCRDDAAAMQFLRPGWSFNPKRPCLAPVAEQIPAEVRTK